VSEVLDLFTIISEIVNVVSGDMIPSSNSSFSLS